MEENENLKAEVKELKNNVDLIIERVEKLTIVSLFLIFIVYGAVVYLIITNLL